MQGMLSSRAADSARLHCRSLLHCGQHKHHEACGARIIFLHWHEYDDVAHREVLSDASHVAGRRQPAAFDSEDDIQSLRTTGPGLPSCRLLVAVVRDRSMSSGRGSSSAVVM